MHASSAPGLASGPATYAGAVRAVSALGGRYQHLAYRPLSPSKLAGRGLCDPRQGAEPPGVRRGPRAIALLVDMLRIRRVPSRRLCHSFLTLFPHSLSEQKIFRD